MLEYSNPMASHFAAPGFFSLPVFHRVILEAAVCLLPGVMIGAGAHPIVSALILFIVCCVAAFWHKQRRRQFPANDALNRRYWRVTTCLAVAMCVLLVHFDRCPHATYISVGPFEFSTARRCWNMRSYRNVFTWLVSPTR